MAFQRPANSQGMLSQERQQLELSAFDGQQKTQGFTLIGFILCGIEAVFSRGSGNSTIEAVKLNV